MDNQQDELQSWKQKYYDAIGDLDTREKQWAEIEQVPVTISCGMSEFLLNNSPEQVFERVDKTLYEAKNSGCNRCCKG